MCVGGTVRNHWSIESMRRGLDVNLLQDMVKRKSVKAARNLHTTSKKYPIRNEPGKRYYAVILS